MQAGLPPQMQSEFSQQRQAYQQKMEAQLARWRANLFTLEAEVNQAQSNARVDFQERLITLKSKLNHLQQHLDKLKETTGDAWIDLQADIEDASQDISQAIGQIQAKFQKEVT